MATVKFRALGKNDPVNLNVRFYHNKLDLYTKSNIFVFFSDWSNKTGKIKQNVDDEIKFVGQNISGNWLFINGFSANNSTVQQRPIYGGIN